MYIYVCVCVCVCVCMDGSVLCSMFYHQIAAEAHRLLSPGGQL